VLERIKTRGDKDPLDVLSALVNSDKTADQLKAQAASSLAPYLHSKNAVAPQSRIISKPIDLPVPSTATEAAAQIVELSAMAAGGEADMEEISILIQHRQAFIGAKTTVELEAQVRVAVARIEELMARLDAKGQ
jgi:hypothetical protein